MIHLVELLSDFLSFLHVSKGMTQSLDVKATHGS